MLSWIDTSELITLHKTCHQHFRRSAIYVYLQDKFTVAKRERRFADSTSHLANTNRDRSSLFFLHVLGSIYQSYEATCCTWASRQGKAGLSVVDMIVRLL